LPARDDGEYIGESPSSESCLGNITANPPNVQQTSSYNVCFVGMQTFPIFFASSPASGNLLIGSYTMNIGSDDGSSMFLDSIAGPFGPGALETSTSYDMVVGSPSGCGYGCPSSWSSNNGNLVSANDGGFFYMHIAYEECCGSPWGLSYWFYTNQSDTFGSGMVLGNVGPGTNQTYFPEAVIHGTVSCSCNGVTQIFPNVPVSVTAKYGTGWTYKLVSSSAGDWGLDIPPSEFASTVSDPYSVSVTPPTGYMVVGATVNGSSTSAPVQTSVGPGFAVDVNFTLAPILHSVAITPLSASMYPYETQNFTASAFCTNGITCPAGITYNWALTNGLGSLNATSGSSVGFTTGASNGILALFANATLSGVSAQSSPAVVNITGSNPTLVSASLSPMYASLKSGGSQAFTATSACLSACPPGTAYSWSLTNSGMATLNASAGTSVDVIAGGSDGTVGLLVNATLYGKTVQSSAAVINITGSGSTLTSVTVSPTSSKIGPGGTQPFVATPVCTGTCPSGTTFNWTLTSGSLGSLNTSTGSLTAFTAGSTQGTLGLFVNATLNGAKVQSLPVVINITSSIPSNLTSVVVSPASASLTPGDEQSFVATPGCSATCPSGIDYTWTLTQGSLGLISAATGDRTTFTAGNTAGTVALFVNATLNGVRVQSSPTVITITVPAPVLISVAVTPTSSSLRAGDNQSFLATPTCTLPCPSGITYSWNLTAGTMGTLSSTTGSSVTFTAGTTGGALGLFVNATLSGVAKQSQVAVIAISVPIPTVISGVIASPMQTIVRAGTAQVFTATPRCTAGGSSVTCPATGIGFAWSLNSTDGSITNTTGVTTQFMAGDINGEVGLKVVATLNGSIVQFVANITVNATVPQTGGSGQSENWNYVILVVILAAIVVIAVFLAAGRRRPPDQEGAEEEVMPAAAFGAGEEDVIPPSEPEPPAVESQEGEVTGGSESAQPEETPVEPSFTDDSEAAEEGPAVDVASTVAWVSKPKAAQEPAPAAQDEAAVAEIQKELEKAQTKPSPPAPSKAVPEAAPKPATTIGHAETAPTLKCFICGTDLKGEYCPTCDMHWYSRAKG
jgi:hypothetical protein